MSRCGGVVASARIASGTVVAVSVSKPASASSVTSSVRVAALSSTMRIL
jgi:hypothetical protein